MSRHNPQSKLSRSFSDVSLRFKVAISLRCYSTHENLLVACSPVNSPFEQFFDMKAKDRGQEHRDRHFELDSAISTAATFWLVSNRVKQSA